MSRTTDAILDGRTWGPSAASQARPAARPFQGVGWYVLRRTGFRGDTILAQVVMGPFMRFEQASATAQRVGGDLFISNDFSTDNVEVQS